MNPLGIHALVWCRGWSEAESREAIQRTAELGFDLIEVPLLEPDSIDVATTRRQLDEFGIGVTCSLGLTFDSDISSTDLDVVSRGERKLMRALDVTRELGSAYLGGVIYSAMGKYERAAEHSGRDNCVAVLRRLADRAASSGIRLGLEPVNRYESNLINTGADAMRLIEDAGAPNIIVHLDTYHMNIEEFSMASAVHESRPRLGYVHIGESHRGYLGTGSVDFEGFFGALAEIGYTGPVTFESFSSRIVSEDFATALAIWRDLWEDNRDLAGQAKTFMETHLRRAGAPEPFAGGKTTAGKGTKAKTKQAGPSLDG